MYVVHVELAYKNSDRNEIWVQDLYHSRALIKVTKKHPQMWQSTVPKTSAKVYGTWCVSVYRILHCNVQRQLNVNTEYSGYNYMYIPM